MDLEIENFIVLVTGGAQGIGKAIVQGIAQEGGIPIFIDQDGEYGNQLAQELKDQKKHHLFIKASLSNAETCKMVVDQTLEKFEKIDALINNAGINDGIGLESGSPELFEQSVNRNLGHYYYMAHYSLPSLIKSKGSIVNISSKTAVTGQGGTSGYAAAKGAILGLTREWAVELMQYRIRVNALVPAEVMTPQYEKWIQKFPDPSTRLKEIKDRIPLGRRMTTPEEIASATVFLISDRASNINGQFWHIDGGYVHLDRNQ